MAQEAGAETALLSVEQAREKVRDAIVGYATSDIADSQAARRVNTALDALVAAAQEEGARGILAALGEFQKNPGAFLLRAKEDKNG